MKVYGNQFIVVSMERSVLIKNHCAKVQLFILLNTSKTHAYLWIATYGKACENLLSMMTMFITLEVETCFRYLRGGESCVSYLKMEKTRVLVILEEANPLFSRQKERPLSIRKTLRDATMASEVWCLAIDKKKSKSLSAR